MTRAQANRVLDAFRGGRFTPKHRIRHALIQTGDMPPPRPRAPRRYPNFGSAR